MSVTVIAEFQCQPGESDNFVELCRDAFPVTREYDGCESLLLSVDQEDENHFVMTEQWNSKDKHLKYIKSREDDGSLAAFVELLTSPPTFTYLDLLST